MRTWWHSYWVGTGTSLSRSTSLQGLYSWAALGLQQKVGLCLDRPLVLNERAFGVSLFLVYVFSRTLSCLSPVGDWTLMSISFSWLCFRHVWSGLLSSVLSLHVMCGLIRRPPDWISFVLSLWFWRYFKLWVPLGLFTCFWFVVSDPLWCFLCCLYCWYVIYNHRYLI